MSAEEPSSSVSEYSTDSTQSGLQAPTSKVWMGGFLQILTRPERLDALRGANVYKIYVFAALLLAVAFTLSSWMTFQSDELRTQTLAMINYVAQHTGQTPQQPAQSFAFTSILGNALMQNGLLGLAMMGLVCWLLHRIVSQEPLRMLAFVGIASYTATISSLGFLLGAVAQLVFHSVLAGFSPAAFMDPERFPFMIRFAMKLDLFTLWAFIAVGLAAAAFQGRSRAYALAIGLGGFLVYAAFNASLVYMGYQYFLSAQH